MDEGVDVVQVCQPELQNRLAFLFVEAF
jgi:hypothetical protein